jgi:hypothetical protein
MICLTETTIPLASISASKQSGSNTSTPPKSADSTSSSWLNMVEHWFGELTQKRVRRGAFANVPDLIAAIDEFLAAWNQDPKPFVWTATVESIVEKLKKCRQNLEQIKPGCTLPKSRKKTRISPVVYETLHYEL